MINFKLRLQNKTTLVSMILALISFVYMVLDAFGIIPQFEQELITKLALGLIDLLVLLGVIVDPTTSGIADSDRAMSYVNPYKSADEYMMNNSNTADEEMK